jgi:hypothetical protein
MKSPFLFLTIIVIQLSSCGIDDSGDGDEMPKLDTYSGYSSTYSSSTGSIDTYMTTTIGDKNGNVTFDGVIINAKDLIPAIKTAAQNALMNTGDRDWNQDFGSLKFDAKITPKTGTLYDNTASVRSSGGQLTIESTRYYSYGSSSDVDKSPLSYSIKITDNNNRFCIIATSPFMDLNTLMTFSITSLSTQIFSSDCTTPLPDKGGLKTLSNTIAPGDSKSKIESVMGTNGLTLTSSTLWTWSGSDRSSGCMDTSYSTCTITFDTSGRVIAVTGIKSGYLTLNLW